MKFGKPKEKSDLEKEIERVVAIMATHDPGTDEYAKINKQLQKLNAQKVAEAPKPLDPATAWTIGANLLGIAMIVGHERAHVVTSRAVGFIRTLR